MLAERHDVCVRDGVGQRAQHGLFAHIDDETDPGEMRILRRALILDADGYETPILSSDGRHLAIRGSAYEQTLHVFKFPSPPFTSYWRRLSASPTRAFHTPSQDWLDRQRAWPRRNIAFGVRPGVHWIGTPTGTLMKVDVEKQSAVEHDALAGTPVSALGVTATVELVVAGSGGEFLLLPVQSDSPETTRADGEASQDTVAVFVDATCEIPHNANPEEHLEVIDGARNWNPGNLSAVTTAADTDPMWLRHRAAINDLFSRDDGRRD